MSRKQEDLNVCIFSPLKNAYSETFIKNHIVHLPFNKIVLNGAELNQLSSNDRPLLSPALVSRIGRKIARKFISEENYFEKKKLRAFLKENKIDVVLAEYGHIGTLIYSACSDLGIPLVVHFHGNDASHQPTLELLGQQYREMFTYASTTIAVSRSMVQRLLKLGALPDRLVYNCYGIDTTLFQAAEKKFGRPTFVSVGRFVEKKAPQLTLAAFAAARQSQPSIRLIMIGDGPLLEACKQLAKAYKLEDSVEFAGILPPEKVSSIVSQSLAFVQHSVIAADGGAEGTPLAILEAGACAVPVISTRHEGIKDVVIENETGILVDEFDIDGMTQAMIRLAANPAQGQEMGAKARAHILQHYTLSRHIDALAERISAAAK
ncbi:MAG TPA: glycosyltransferase family 4 protein [Puia sp.]